MTHGSLFSGIGGFDLGFERAGITTVWQVEIDPWCRKVLERHFPGARRYEDIRTVLVNPMHGGHPHQDWQDASEQDSNRAKDGLPCAASHLESVSIISGGFPCQPVSQAGKRQGAGDSRYLWPEMFAVIRILKPSWVVAENVYGLITHDGGRLLDKVYDDLEGEGYETLPPIVLPACAFGAPHRRDRVWIVAHSERFSGELRAAERERQGRLAGGGVVAYPDENNGRASWPGQDQITPAGLLEGPGESVSDHDCARLAQFQGQRTAAETSGATEFNADHWWSIEPAVGRVAHGIPRRLDRLKGLGNAIVPQIAEWLGRQIVKIEYADSERRTGS